MTDREARRRRQAGFTLIELLVASAIGVVLMTGLSSVVLTTYRANQTAVSRAQASGEIRNFQQAAYDDFALSSLPAAPVGCGTIAQPCAQQPIKLQGCSYTNPSAPSLQSHSVSYAWDASAKLVDRQVGATAVNPAASSVTGFGWYIDGAAPNQTVVVTITVTVGGLSQTQTLRFYPRVAAQLPAYVSAPC